MCMRNTTIWFDDFIDFNDHTAKLDPNRPSRRFSDIKKSEDPKEGLKDKQASRWERLNALADDAADELALEKKKAQREEADKQLEEK